MWKLVVEIIAGFLKLFNDQQLLNAGRALEENERNKADGKKIAEIKEAQLELFDDADIDSMLRPPSDRK